MTMDKMKETYVAIAQEVTGWMLSANPKIETGNDFNASDQWGWMVELAEEFEPLFTAKMEAFAKCQDGSVEEPDYILEIEAFVRQKIDERTSPAGDWKMIYIGNMSSGDDAPLLVKESEFVNGKFEQVEIGGQIELYYDADEDCYYEDWQDLPSELEEEPEQVIKAYIVS